MSHSSHLYGFMPSQISERIPIAKRKSKTFTGCWTCRARRVKCDEARPVCGRCTRARVDCQGYGVRLAWKQYQVGRHSSSSLSRKLIELDRDIAQETLGQVDDMLQKCNTVTVSRETQSFGPFSVFSTIPDHYQLSSDLLDPLHCTISEELELSSMSSEYPSSLPYATSMTTSLSPALISTEEFSSSVVTQEWFGQFSGDESFALNVLLSGSHGLDQEVLSDTMAVEDQHDGNSPQHKTTAIVESASPIDEGGHNESLSDSDSHLNASLSQVSISPCQRVKDITTSAAQHELVHHWLIFMCKNLIPVDTVDNPYRVLYLRLASQALSSPSNCPSSVLAVFHGLCAAAAESLNNLRDQTITKSNFSSTWHANRALQSLQISVAGVSMEDYVAVLAAIIMCILRDTVTGQPRNWRIHVRAALGLLKEPLMSGVQPTANAHVLIEQYLCIAVLGNLPTDYDLETLIAGLPTAENYLYKQHSLTKAFLEFVASINKLSKTGQSVDPVVLDELQIRIYLEAAPDVCNSSSSQAKDSMIIRHYHHVHYYALLVYFHRVLRQKPPGELQDLVEEGLCHMEAAEGLAVAFNGCFLLWPCLVIASECNETRLRERALEWFRKKGRHGFNSVNMALRICQEYWGWRDRHPLECLGQSWQDFVIGTDLDIVPV